MLHLHVSDYLFICKVDLEFFVWGSPVGVFFVFFIRAVNQSFFIVNLFFFFQIDLFSSGRSLHIF